MLRPCGIHLFSPSEVRATVPNQGNLIRTAPSAWAETLRLRL